DPEKNKRLFKIAEQLYLNIVNADVTDDLDSKALMQSALESVSEEDSEFYSTHKHDSFHKGTKLFEANENNLMQKELAKGGYIGLRIIKKGETLHQVLKYLVEAKIQLHKDKLLKELKALRTKENLRYSLFEQEGFKQIADFN